RSREWRRWRRCRRARRARPAERRPRAVWRSAARARRACDGRGGCVGPWSSQSGSGLGTTFVVLHEEEADQYGCESAEREAAEVSAVEEGVGGADREEAQHENEVAPHLA